MKKLYKIILLLAVLIFISTYNPNELGSNFKNNYDFFKVQKILVLNNTLVKKNIIKNKLDHIYKKNIFLIKRQDVEESLKEVDFLEKIEVKKKYPNTVIIKIFETKPVGILFKNKDKYIMDNLANLILFYENSKFIKLPNIFGDGAEKDFLNFFDKLNVNKFPKEEIKNFFYFRIGRWDLELVNNKTIKFPHNVKNDVIKKSIELLQRKDFQNYNIIDLRIDGKIIVE